MTLSTKDVSEKSRKAAFELIKEIGILMLQNPTKSEVENVAEYFELLLSGFAGSPEGIAASVLAISHAVHEFHERISKELLDMLMDNMNLLLASNIREIVQNVFGFFKVMLSNFADVQLGCHVAKMVQNISALNENFRRHFRCKIKDLFTMLIRKFGYSMIVGLVPEDDLKLLNNIRKTEDRKKRQKKEKREIKDDSKKQKKDSISGQSRAETVNDILDELASSDEEPEAEEKKSKKKSTVYIAEDNDEEIVDFTDPKASQKISGDWFICGHALCVLLFFFQRCFFIASGTDKKSKRKGSEFEISADGKIVITNDDNDDDERDGGNDAMSLSSKLSGLSLQRKKVHRVLRLVDSVEKTVFLSELYWLFEAVLLGFDRAINSASIKPRLDQIGHREKLFFVF